MGRHIPTVTLAKYSVSDLLLCLSTRVHLNYYNLYQNLFREESHLCWLPGAWMPCNRLTSSQTQSDCVHFNFFLLFNFVFCLVKMVNDLWVQVLFPLFFFYLLELLIGSLFGYFFVVIVGCTFLDDWSYRRRRIFCVNTLLGRISSELDTCSKEETLSHLV